MLVVKVGKKKRHMVQGSEEYEAVINIKSVQERFEREGAVVQP